MTIARYLTELALASVATTDEARERAQDRAASYWLALTPDEQDEADWLKAGRPLYPIELRD